MVDWTECVFPPQINGGWFFSLMAGLSYIEVVTEALGNKPNSRCKHASTAEFVSVWYCNDQNSGKTSDRAETV